MTGPNLYIREGMQKLNGWNSSARSEGESIEDLFWIALDLGQLTVAKQIAETMQHRKAFYSCVLAFYRCDEHELHAGMENLSDERDIESIGSCLPWIYNEKERILLPTSVRPLAAALPSFCKTTFLDEYRNQVVHGTPADLGETGEVLRFLSNVSERASDARILASRSFELREANSIEMVQLIEMRGSSSSLFMCLASSYYAYMGEIEKAIKCLKISAELTRNPSILNLKLSALKLKTRLRNRSFLKR